MTDLKVYLAAPYGQRLKMQELARHLTDVYHITITSRWVWDGEETPDTPASYWANADVQDVASADMMLIFPSGDDPGTGRHVELGVALALGKRIVAIGPLPDQGIFYHHDTVEHYVTLAEWYGQFAENTL